METDLIVAVAQISTGVATLLVAIFLATQIVLQRKQLDRAHLDAERELAFSAAVRRDNIVFARLSNPTVESTFMKGWEDLSNLEGPAEINRFQSYARLLESCLNYDWTLGRDNNELSMFDNQIEVLLSNDSMRKHYQQVGRRNIHHPELRRLMDERYELLAGKPIDVDMNSDTGYKDFRRG